MVVPLLVTVSGNAVTPMVAAAYRQTIALKSNGTVLTVGNDTYGQLGLGRVQHATGHCRLRQEALTRWRSNKTARSGHGAIIFIPNLGMAAQRLAVFRGRFLA